MHRRCSNTDGAAQASGGAADAPSMENPKSHGILTFEASK